MENEYDKKIDEWFSVIGPDKFKIINDLIDSTVNELSKVVEKDEFLSAAEAGLFRLAAHVITPEQFMMNITQEYEYCVVSADKVMKIDPILRNFISNSLIDLEQNKEDMKGSDKNPDAPSPADILTRLNQNLTKPTTLAPTKREYITPTTSSKSTIDPVTKPATDPYREDVSNLS